MSSLHFDPYQFAGRRNHAADVEYTRSGWTSNGISYDDSERMSTHNSSVPVRHRRLVPAFAASDEKLRRVLLYKAWAYVHATAKFPPPDNWKSINAAATKKALEKVAVIFQDCPEHKRGESEAHVAAVKRAGGYLELQGALAYSAWRLGQDSVAIAEALGMSPQAVRVNLQRLCNVARSLGYDTFSRHSSFRRPRAKGKGTATKKNDVFALLKVGVYKGRGRAAGQRVN